VPVESPFKSARPRLVAAQRAVADGEGGPQDVGDAATPAIGAVLSGAGLLSLVPDENTMFHKPYTVPRFVWEEIRNPKVLEDLKALDKESKI